LETVRDQGGGFGVLRGDQEEGGHGGPAVEMEGVDGELAAVSRVCRLLDRLALRELVLLLEVPRREAVFGAIPEGSPLPELLNEALYFIRSQGTTPGVALRSAKGLRVCFAVIPETTSGVGPVALCERMNE
jgi:hypothetical protein